MSITQSLYRNRKETERSVKLMMLLSFTLLCFAACSTNDRFRLSGDRNPHGHIPSRRQGYAHPKDQNYPPGQGYIAPANNELENNQVEQASAAPTDESQ
jgi:hypothetical protein